MPSKRIVCLASSYKNGGHCVAGVEYNGAAFGSWIRPVSNRPGRAINLSERTYAGGIQCSVLDVVDIDFVHHVPDGYQSENWLIQSGTQWGKVGVLPVGALAPALHDGGGPLWPHTSNSKGGMADRISAADLGNLASSLALVRPAACAIQVSTNPFTKKLDVRASFDWGSQHNNLKVTDPVACAKYQGQGVGRYNLNNPTLCISIGEIFAARNEAYKIVAGIC